MSDYRPVHACMFFHGLNIYLIPFGKLPCMIGTPNHEYEDIDPDDLPASYEEPMVSTARGMAERSIELKENEAYGLFQQ